MSLSGYREIETYTYLDPHGDPYLRATRWHNESTGRKTFRQSFWDRSRERWVSTAPEDLQRYLYRLEDLAAAAPGSTVLFVEGEKDVDRARDLGFLAVTTPMGAGAVDKLSDWSSLAGHHVVILPDNDEAGAQYGQQVAEHLAGIAASIKIVNLLGLPPKGDLSDWLDAGGTVDQLRATIDAAIPLLSSADPANEEGISASRVFTERAFVCSAWDHQTTAQVLATFKPAQFKDPVSRSAAAAICSLLKDDEAEIEPLGVGMQMRRQGTFDHWSTLEAFHSQRLAHLGQARGSTYRAFREACDWDDASALVGDMQATLATGTFREWISKYHESMADLLARSSTTALKTLRDHVEDWLESYIEGKDSRETFPLTHLSDLTGEFGGGDVIVTVGAPKTGKSSWLLDIIVDAAERGIKSLVGDLEMRMEQIVKRAVSKLLRKPVTEVTPADAVRLLESGKLDHLNNIYYTSRCRSLDKYRVEVSSVLAKHRDIKIWATDYAECIQNFGGGANRVDESEAIAKMIKDTAVAFDVTAILMVQPNQDYTRNGATGPKTYHAKNSAKWEQDAQAMVFLHSPARFFEDMPKEYLEVHVLACRDSETGVIPLRWSPSTFAYSRWAGPVPAGGGRSLAAQTQMDRHATPLEEINLEQIL